MTADEQEAREALERARARNSRADDGSIWWAPCSDGGVMTHLLRRDGSWTVYRSSRTEARALERGTKT